MVRGQIGCNFVRTSNSLGVRDVRINLLVVLHMCISCCGLDADAALFFKSCLVAILIAILFTTSDCDVDSSSTFSAATFHCNPVLKRFTHCCCKSTFLAHCLRAQMLSPVHWRFLIKRRSSIRGLMRSDKPQKAFPSRGADTVAAFVDARVAR